MCSLRSRARTNFPPVLSAYHEPRAVNGFAVLRSAPALRVTNALRS
jgi:hypothetical protein